MNEIKSNNITIGILAHVDAGKTTLSESLLYRSGSIRTHGRVDHQDAFLDTDAMEKKRGITIFSKMARFSVPGEDGNTKNFILLDTPGHADFSPETERTLRVLDLAVLVISASEGVTEQVRVLWKLLSHYQVPVYVFVNKIDQIRAGLGNGSITEKQNEILETLNKELGKGFVIFGEDQLSENNEENVAELDDELIRNYFEGISPGAFDVIKLIENRKLFPVYFGAALLDEGTDELLAGLGLFARAPKYSDRFGAIVYKITRNGRERITWMKITGGSIAVRDDIIQKRPAQASAENDEDSEGSDTVSEKVTGIRLYNGEKFESVTKAYAGEIVAVMGLSYTNFGDGLGDQESVRDKILSPIMTVRIIPLPDGEGKLPDDFTVLKALRSLEEEEPMLQASLDERTHDITINIMGQIQTEIIKNLMMEKFGIGIDFGPGRIVYKETIRRPVEGVGHFEPLRHYAEAHVLLEPLPTGSGLVFENRCAPNTLDKNWQRLIMTHLEEKTFRGVLTGSQITDMRISLLGGKANLKHTSGGDFRQAAYRAVRQGLMSAQNVLLEPVLEYTLELPSQNLGRAMTDINAMGGTTQPPEFIGDNAVMTGTIPASTFGSYAQELSGYTQGAGHIQTTLKDYMPCHNAREVLDGSSYDPDLDKWNPSYSVFCSHGAGTPVSWNLVRKYMHVDTGWKPLAEGTDGPKEDGSYLTDDYYTFDSSAEGEDLEIDGLYASNDDSEAADLNAAPDRSARRKAPAKDFAGRQAQLLAEDNELRSIFEQTYRTEYRPHKKQLRNPENEKYYDDLGNDIEEYSDEAGDDKENAKQVFDKYAAKNKNAVRPLDYLLIDGYNIIFAWSELAALAASDIKAARDKLIDIISDYAGYSGEIVILVFDAYKVSGGKGEIYKVNDIDIVYTKEAETADLYIEKTAHSLTGKHRVTVATSDAIEQVIIFGSGAIRLSARGLLERVIRAKEDMRDRFISEAD